jgi:hypothetical protein
LWISAMKDITAIEAVVLMDAHLEGFLERI